MAQPIALADADLFRSASHRNVAAHLVGPLAAGARDHEVPVDAGGIADLARSAREPVLVASLRASLAGAGATLRAVLDPGGAGTALPDLRFEAWTEAGAFLPLHLPPVDPGTRQAQPLRIALALVPDGAAAVAPAEVAARVEVRVVEGLLGRLLYAATAEKARMRRVGRQIVAARRLATASGPSLDRHGEDLRVPRFTERLRYQPGAGGGTLVTEAAAEPDADYRRRLALYRPLLVPSRRTALRLLDGAGSPGDPNRGPLGELGLAARLDLVESANPFAIAVHVVSSAGAARRDALFAFLRRAHLVEPAVAVPADRRIPSGRRTAEDALRARLRASFDFAAGRHVARRLAAVLDVVGEVRRALGVARRWKVLRAQDPAGGSRYELGLGVDLEVPPPGELTALAAAAAGPLAAGTAPEVAAIVAGLSPRPAAADAEGRWLLEGCGMRTVHPLDATRFYASHLPTFGLVVSGPDAVAVGAAAALDAAYHAPGDPGGHAALVEGLARATADWAAAGRPAWTQVPRATWATAVPTPPPPAPILAGAGFPAVDRAQRLADALISLARLPDALVATLRLDAAQAGRIRAGDVAEIAVLRQLADVLRAAGISAALPLVTGAGDVLLVVSLAGLPEAGLNLLERRTVGFRWYAVPVQGPAGQLRPAGVKASFTPGASGLTAIVVLGYARRGGVDPYEVRVEMPPGSVLDLRQYEFLMNLLEHAVPAGVEVNTFGIRREHVDLDGDGVADPMPPRFSRTFRPFRR